MERTKEKHKRSFVKKNLKWIIFFIAVILFIEALNAVLAKEIIERDTRIYNFLSLYIIRDWLTPFVKLITTFGSAWFLIILACILFFVIKNRRIALSIPLNLGLAAGLNFILKNIIQRDRPIGYRLIEQKGYSFPSGHSMVGAAMYGYLIYLIHKKVKDKTNRQLGIVYLLLLIVLIGISRIYLGVHYASDVYAGLLLGFAYLTVYTSLIDDFIGTANKDKR